MPYLLSPTLRYVGRYLSVVTYLVVFPATSSLTGDGPLMMYGGFRLKDLFNKIKFTITKHISTVQLYYQLIYRLHLRRTRRISKENI